MAKINKDIFGEAAIYLQRNSEVEAESLQGYQEMLNVMTNQSRHDYIFRIYDNATGTEKDSPTAAADRKMYKLIIEQVKEIISDELNHQKKLQTLYEAVTGFSAAEE